MFKSIFYDYIKWCLNNEWTKIIVLNLFTFFVHTLHGVVVQLGTYFYVYCTCLYMKPVFVVVTVKCAVFTSIGSAVSILWKI